MRTNTSRPIILFEHDSGGGAGAGGSDNDDRILAGLQKLIERNEGSEAAAARVLYEDNYKLREQIRQMKEQIPGADQTVIPAAEAQALAAYRELGELDALRESLAERERLADQMARLERTNTLRDVAEAAGVQFGALADLDQLEQDLAYEIREDEIDGQRRRTVYVQAGAGEGAEPQPLIAYVEAKRPHLLPALQPPREEPAGSGGSNSGTPYPRQSPGGAQATAATTDQIRERKQRSGSYIAF